MTNEETNTNEGALSPQVAPVAPERPSSKKGASRKLRFVESIKKPEANNTASQRFGFDSTPK
jgi:hypothetical protein